MPTQIVQCANFVTPRSGGLRTAMRHLAEQYTAAGYAVVQVVPGPRTTSEETPWGRIEYVRAPVVPGTGYRVIAEPRRVARLLERLNPDRLEVHDRFTLRGLGGWAHRRGVPSMVISHERLDQLARRVLPGGPPLRRAVEESNRRLAVGFDTVVATTDWAAEEFRRLGVPNLVQIPLGVDLTVFQPSNYDHELRARFAPHGLPLLAAAVRLSPEKEPKRVVETVRELVHRGRAVHCVIAGDGPLRARLERSAVGLPITFLGYLDDRATLGRLLATADVFLAPGPVETFGLAALEALACGTPVVVDRGSALPEVIDTAGFAVSGTPASYAAAVETLLELPQAQLRRAARDRAECFPWELTGRNFLAAHRLGVVHEGVP
ncbi:MAG TPA: glycosyltransferase [Sporichthyaceae bacterium]|nr:glycosyltransferase [Sporichthyaceae bacterium]